MSTVTSTVICCVAPSRPHSTMGMELSTVMVEWMSTVDEYNDEYIDECSDDYNDDCSDEYSDEYSDLLSRVVLFRPWD
jgi:hypothetical protein